MTPNEADDLTQLRAWAREPSGSPVPVEVVAGWVKLLFRRCSELADLTARYLEMQEEVKCSEAQARCYQSEIVRLRRRVNA